MILRCKQTTASISDHRDHIGAVLLDGLLQSPLASPAELPKQQSIRHPAPLLSFFYQLLTLL